MPNKNTYKYKNIKATEMHQSPVKETHFFKQQFILFKEPV
jgi:hypothetical protein